MVILCELSKTSIRNKRKFLFSSSLEKKSTIKSTWRTYNETSSTFWRTFIFKSMVMQRIWQMILINLPVSSDCCKWKTRKQDVVSLQKCRSNIYTFYACTNSSSFCGLICNTLCNNVTRYFGAKCLALSLKIHIVG